MNHADHQHHQAVRAQEEAHAAALAKQEKHFSLQASELQRAAEQERLAKVSLQRRKANVFGMACLRRLRERLQRQRRVQIIQIWRGRKQAVLSYSATDLARCKAALRNLTCALQICCEDKEALLSAGASREAALLEQEIQLHRMQDLCDQLEGDDTATRDTVRMQERCEQTKSQIEQLEQCAASLQGRLCALDEREGHAAKEAQALQLEVDRLQEKARLQGIKLKRATQDAERFKEEASRLARLHDVREAEKQFVTDAPDELQLLRDQVEMLRGELKQKEGCEQENTQLRERLRTREEITETVRGAFTQAQQRAQQLQHPTSRGAFKRLNAARRRGDA